MTWFFRPVLTALLALAAPATLHAAPIDLPEAGARDAAAVSQALQRFTQAFKARHLAAAEGAARDAWNAGGGSEALEALAVTALQAGRVPRAHQLYLAIIADAEAPEDVQRRAKNQLAAMARQTGELTVRGGAEGAVVAIDGDAVAKLPLAVAPRAMPGRRVVTVGAYRTTVRFAAGRTTQVVVPAGASGPAVAAVGAAVTVPTAVPAPGAAVAEAKDAAREAVAEAKDAAREAVGEAREQLTAAALARPEVQAALEARDRALKARAALAKLRPERLRELIQNDPELKQALAALTDDQAVLQQVALAMQSGGGVEGVGRQLASDARVQRVLERLKALLLVETGVQEVIE
jgi:hypothetical protein